MYLKIIVIPTDDDELDMIDSALIDKAQHELLDLWEEADWVVKKQC